MRDGGKVILGLLVVLFFLFLLIVVMPAQRAATQEKIRGWAREQEAQVVEIQECQFDTGPFWFVDGESEEVWWMKARWGGREREAYFRVGPWGAFEARWKD